MDKVTKDFKELYDKKQENVKEFCYEKTGKKEWDDIKKNTKALTDKLKSLQSASHDKQLLELADKKDKKKAEKYPSWVRIPANGYDPCPSAELRKMMEGVKATLDEDTKYAK